MSYAIAKARMYTASKAKQKVIIAYDKIDATKKWVEYSLDQIDLNKALQTSSFTDKCIILQALKVVERKLEYHYKHKNFCMSTATTQLKQARRLLKM
jgi:hypothetical protein